MKKLLLIVLLIGATLQESQAKIQAGVGIKVGPAFGRWNNEFQKRGQANAGGTLGFKTGLHAGLQGRIWFNKFIGINLAAEFNMSGNTFKGTKGTIITTATHKENQLTIPVTAMAGWGNERMRLFANVGGFFGYNISGTNNTEVNNSGSETSTGFVKTDYKNDLQSIDAGLRLGAGLQIYVDKKLRSCVTFDINYDYGFIKVHRNTPPDYFMKPETLKLTNSKLMIGVGFIYSFGKNQAEEKPNRPVPVIEE